MNYFKKKSIETYAFIFITLFILFFVSFNNPIIITRYGHDVLFYFDYIYRVNQNNENLTTLSAYSPHIFKILNFFDQYLKSFFIIDLLKITISIPWIIVLFFVNLNVYKITLIFLNFLLLLNIYHLGDVEAITYANFYNRIAFFLLLNLIIFYNQNNKFLSYVKGYSIAFLFFIKIPFFIAGIIVAFLEKERKKIFFIAILLLVMIALLDIKSMLAIINNSHEISNVFRNKLLNNFNEIRTDTYIKSFFIILSLYCIYEFYYKNYQAIINIIFFILITFCSCFIYQSSHEPYLILFGVFLLSFKNHLLRNIVFILVALIFIKSSSIAVISNVNEKKLKENYKISLNSIKDVYIKNADGYLNEKYADVINEGKSLISECLRINSDCKKINIVSFENILSRELNLPPQNFSIIPIHYNSNFNDEHHPVFEKYMHEDFFIIRNGADLETTVPFMRIYKDELTSFSRILNNNYWTIYQRKSTVQNN